MTTLANLPDVPIVEEWQWQTDTIVSTDGSEQRIELLEFPKRLLKLNYVIDDKDELRAFAAAMLKFGAAYDVPLFQYATRLTVPALAAATTLAIVNARTDLRIGRKAYVYDASGGEVVTISGLTDTTATLAAGLSRPYGLRTNVAPVAALYSVANVSLDRLNPDRAGMASLTLREVAFWVPFLSSYNTATLTTLNDVPVLERRPIGSTFTDAIDTGVTNTDFGSVVEFRNLWLHSKRAFARDFLCNRVLNPADWDYWRAFADYAKGSCNPFYMPSYRSDFELVSFNPAVRTAITIGGALYRTDYFPFETYKQIAITTDGGVHYAAVSAAVVSGDNTALTFAPALPSGEGWDNVTLISFLLKCRIADDKVSCEHNPLHTQISLQLRTVDE